MTADHVIDPNGHVTLPNALTVDLCDRPCTAATASTLHRKGTDFTFERPKKRARTSGKNPASTGEPTSSKVQNPNTQTPKANGQKPETTATPEPIPKETRIQVSGKKLSLASSLFAQMDQAASRKKRPKNNNGSIEINLVGWVINALLIALYIILEQHDKVPRRLGVQILAKIALVGTYYGCACVLMYGDIWHEKLKSEALLDCYGNELCLLAWVSYYFRWAGCFNACCLICIETSPSIITLPGFPVLKQTIDAMNKARESPLHKLIPHIYGIRDRVIYDAAILRDICRRECCLYILRSLATAMHSLNLKYVQPKEPYHGISCKDVKGFLRDQSSALIARKAIPLEQLASTRWRLLCRWCTDADPFQCSTVDIKELNMAEYMVQTMLPQREGFGHAVCAGRVYRRNIMHWTHKC
ncbi:hypothetical protein BJX65DRAFT_304165 [Aspergillus insuetus]